MVDEATKKTLGTIPLLSTRAGPRDGDKWVTRLKEEYMSLIKVIKYSPQQIIINNYYSMLVIIKRLVLTGLDWNQIKKEPGNVKVVICYSY